MAVYFVQCGSGGPIKIGYAKNPAKRIAALATSSPAPLSIVGLIEEGTKAGEARLHRRFRHLRVYGEWFRPAEELLTFCQAPSMEPDDPEPDSPPGRLRALIAKRIAEGRYKSQADVARSIGVAQRAFSHWYSGRSTPRYLMLSLICDELGTHPNYLLGFTDAERPISAAPAEAA